MLVSPSPASSTGMTSSYSRTPIAPEGLPHDTRNWSHPSSPTPPAILHPSDAMQRAPSSGARLGTAGSSSSQTTLNQQRARTASHSNGRGPGAAVYASTSSTSPLPQPSSSLTSPFAVGRTRLPSSSPAIGPTNPFRSAPLQSHVYGLTPDLRGTAPPLAAAADGANKSRTRQLPHEQKANFSVELFASQFDQRGYPILFGKGAPVQGVIRMPATAGCDVMMKISAHTTAGAQAAVWDGVALAPFDLGDERKVFEVRDRLVANFDLARPRDAFAPRNEAMMEPPSLSKEDFVLPIPFDVKLPLGKATRVVDGELQAIPVSLPPSFEISSKMAAQERREMRIGTKGKTRGLAAKELVEKGFEKVYRIGCYYQVTWTLLRDGVKEQKRGKHQKDPVAAEGDSLTVPFIFLGEPTSLPPYPPTIPSSLSPKIFTHPGTELGDQWDVHRATGKWSGSLLRATRRSVDIELHIPAHSIIQSPSHLPMLLIIRPHDPTLLQSVRSGVHSGSSTAPGSPDAGAREDPIESLVKTNGDQAQRADSDGESIRTTRSIMSRFIRPSINLTRNPGSGASVAGSSRKAGGSGSSIFSSRRPNTAPSTGSSETGASDSLTNRTYNPNGAIPDLASLVCVSLIQTTYSSTEGVNDTPESRRKIVSVADLEEVDVHALLLSSLPCADDVGAGRSADELATIHEVSASAKAAGIRVLVGSLTVNQATPPSFRCQGLEVKYAMKVDLMPASRVGGDGMERAFRNLGIRSGRNRGLSEGYSTTSSIHTQTQFTQLSNGSTPPTTPPSAGGTTRAFGAMSPAPGGLSPDRPGYPGVPESAGFYMSGTSPPVAPAAGLQGVGVAFSTQDRSARPAKASEPEEVLSPDVDSVARFPGGPVQRAMPSYPHNVGGSGASVSGSSRSGWGSGQSVSEASYTQSSSFMSEWGKDRKTVSKLHKTLGELWIDVRMVRAQAL